ncbi:probable basic-leucine zipper transcription factor Q [Toxorhynchites rutilus septentrionalis]|uniref:probable basic-leucine zipper transcription factor Q n=1 Tax=Toxorhynchites rutilus septentrionalis TaxID=329112 RepID=UPI00247913B5|nr:probable basic-leucine zipper transcription factor Q [Toxorhynchites rutilus septentrionalis]
MTEELQSQQQTQQCQQQQQQQPQQKSRLGPNDYRNSEFVTKLMAANPPYLYSPAIGPHNFFFSEMLRSLVANKRNESLRNAEQLHHQQQQHQQQQQQHQQQTQSLHTRRPRKRSWSQHRLYPESPKESKEPDEKTTGQPEKPLELTNKLSAFSRNITSKYDDSSDSYKSSQETKPPIDKAPVNNSHIPDPPTASMPPSDLILPPPPPVWYPPLCPPYGIDPLHFFIDLRVSGHIYDRKKELTSPNSDGAAIKTEHSKLIGSSDRHGSAFSVPKPRDGLGKLGNSAIDLASSPLPSEGDEKHSNGHPSPLMLLDGFKENKYDIIKSTNYVMQNLPRIYSDLNHTQKEGGDDEINGNLSDDQLDCKSVGSNEDYPGDGERFRDADLNVISDEDESIAVDEN